MTETTHRYPTNNISNALNLAIKVCIICAGIVFLYVYRPEPWQAKVFVPLFIAFMGFGAYGNISNILESEKRVRLAPDGIHVERWQNELLFISWEEIQAIRPKGRLGGLWIDTLTTPQALAIDHTIGELDQVKAVLRERVGPWEEG